MKTYIKILLILFLFLILILLLIFFIREVSSRQLDDISLLIPCEDNLLQKADVFYVIPNFDNKSIAENKNWCQEILALNKTLALHGVYHTYNEFNQDRNQDYLNKGILIFQECFNKTPKNFKAPQLAISDNNKKLIKKSNMKLDSYFNQIFHKVYHCNDTGFLKNWVPNLI